MVHRNPLARRALQGLTLAFLVLAAPARAAEITAFVSGAGPAEAWTRGYGGTLTITLLDLVHGELEGMSQHSDLPDTRFVSGSAKAYLGPTFGRLVPYAGLGVGIYHWGRESDVGSDDNSGYSLAFIGLKLKLPAGIVARGEYQWLNVEESLAMPLDHRVLVGVGLRF
jgi:opacity protein-like surface antigen